MGAGELRERDHLSARVAYVPAPQVLREHARIRIALYEHLLDTPTIDELIDKGRSPSARQCVAHGRNRKAQGTCLFPVDIQLVLGLIIQSVRTDHADVGVLRGQLQQLAARPPQYRVADIWPVDDI